MISDALALTWRHFSVYDLLVLEGMKPQANKETAIIINRTVEGTRRPFLETKETHGGINKMADILKATF